MSMRILGGQVAHSGPTRQEPEMTEQATITRRTSVYTIRLNDPSWVEDVAGWISGTGFIPAQPGTPVTDRGESSVSFRAAGDTAARQVVGTALHGFPEIDYTLTTGLGIHRRTVNA